MKYDQGHVLAELIADAVPYQAAEKLRVVEVFVTLESRRMIRCCRLNLGRR